MSAIPSAAPAPTPFPEGDPRNARYFEQVAALEHQRSNSLASGQQDLADAQASYKYGLGQLEQQLPLTLQTTRSTANRQGLLESGQLAQRVGTVESKYAAQRGRLASNLQAEENKVNTADQQANEAFALGQSKAAQATREESLAQTEKEAPNEAVATPAVKPAVTVPPRIIAQRAQPTTLSRGARNRAAKKAIGVG